MHVHAERETSQSAARGARAGPGSGPAPWSSPVRGRAELTSAAAEALAASRAASEAARTEEQAVVLARWATRRRRKGIVHWLAMSCPYFGPVLIGVATAVWTYVLLVLVRHLVV